MKTTDYSYFIERYNTGEMSESEIKWFLMEMEGNEHLRKEVELRKRTDDILRSSDIISLRTKLVELENIRSERSGRLRLTRNSMLKYAAVFAGIVIVSSLFLFTGKPVSGDEIINQFYKTYEPPSSQRSGSSSTNADFIMGLKYYKDQDYRNAAFLFTKVLESNPDDMQTQLLSGVSNMEEKKYTEAKKSFTTVIDDNNNLFIESARWYLALCYVKTEENIKAEKMLEIIWKDGGIYSNDAKKVMKRLRR